MHHRWLAERPAGVWLGGWSGWKANYRHIHTRANGLPWAARCFLLRSKGETRTEWCLTALKLCSQLLRFLKQQHEGIGSSLAVLEFQQSDVCAFSFYCQPDSCLILNTDDKHWLGIQGNKCELFILFVCGRFLWVIVQDGDGRWIFLLIEAYSFISTGIHVPAFITSTSIALHDSQPEMSL